MLKSLMRSLAVLGAMAMPLLCAAPAQAQVSRTWVSGVGMDSNPCSRTQPCQTWAAAIAVTANGGEISALDPGGFGPLTITKSITLDGGGGQVASSLTAGTHDIIINATSTDIVILRNVRLQGLLGNGGNPGNAGVDGIKLLSAGTRLVVDNCDITGFAMHGIEIAAAGFVAINNTRIENVAGVGILVDSPSPATVKVDNVHVYAANFGFGATNGNQMFISRSDVSGAATGVKADTGSLIVLNNNDITFNNTGINGQTQSYNNNRVLLNGSPGTTPTIAPTASPDPNGLK